MLLKLRRFHEVFTSDRLFSKKRFDTSLQVIFPNIVCPFIILFVFINRKMKQPALCYVVLCLCLLYEYRYSSLSMIEDLVSVITFSIKWKMVVKGNHWEEAFPTNLVLRNTRNVLKNLCSIFAAMKAEYIICVSEIIGRCGINVFRPKLSWIQNWNNHY